ncbi:MAG: DNA polymerase I [Candidatus Omnitrophota bacterium]|nr:MAG: DNA polymerase I [Candidatus Omnitrophota bacterium]
MSDKPNKRFFLIDGNSFCYRAYYAIRHLSNSKGQPTNAIYGVITMIKKIIKEEKPDMIAVAFDLKGPTFRHEKFKDYKITRKPMPEDLVSQLPHIKRLLKAYNIPIYEVQGYEADDVLATLAQKCAKTKNIDTYIVTGDKDMLQLVGPHIKVYSPHREGFVYDEKAVREKFGIGPDKITDLMALMGDTSDNIPGVPGIGEKTAIELMKEFKSLDQILKNPDRIKSESRRKKIEESRPLALLSKELAIIKRDVPIEINFEDLDLKPPDEKALIELFKELEFRTLLKDIAPRQKPKGAYHSVDCRKEFIKLARALKRLKRFAFDFETTHYDPMQASPVGVSFCWKEGESFYIPFNALKDISTEEITRELKPIFEDNKIKKIGQNIKYDLLILKNMGIAARGIEFDTMVASYLLNPSKSNHNLKDISLEYLARPMSSIEELLGKGKKAITMDKVDPRKVRDYSCEDSDVTFTLKGVLEEKLREKNLNDLFFNVEIPLIDVLVDMEWHGVNIDTGYLAGLSKDIGVDIASCEKNIYKLAGEKFNINSPKQLRVILFEKLKMPIVKKIKTGASTNEGVLRTLSEKEELPKEILRYRELAKLRSTYVDNLPGLINGRTGRIHTSFNQTVTATGRLSSSKPNLQNIPIKTRLGRKIRRAFVAKNKRDLILSADYSQVELRILAHLSGDKNLINAFARDKDIHKFTASLIYGLEEKDITGKMRQTAKTVNFGIIYGMSAYGLSRDLGIDVREASKFIDAYFERYPDVKDYLEKEKKNAMKNGFVTTILGRRRYIPEINSSNMAVRNFAERTAINAPIQGSAADLIKLAMISIHRLLDGFDARMILQVHDELVFEVGEEVLEKFAGKVKDKMENVMDFKLPIKVDLESGRNWLDMETVAI